MGHKLIHTPGYLMRRGSLFYYRQRVPSSVVETVGRAEIRQSLGTGNLREAHRIAVMLGMQYDAAFRNPDPTKIMVDIDRIRRLGLGAGMGLKIDYQPGGRVTIESDPNCPHERAAALEALKIVAGQQAPAVTTLAPVSVAPAPAANGPTTLAALVKDYIATRSKPDRLGKFMRGWELEEKRKERAAAIAILVDILGDIPLSSINLKSMEKAWSDLRMLPPNWSKAPQFRGKSIGEIVKMQADAQRRYVEERDKLKTAEERAKLDQSGFVRFLAYKTLEWYESAWSGLFEYAINNEYTLTRNHAKGLKKGLAKNSVPKLPFTTDQLRAIFEGTNFKTRSADDPAKYWVPTMLLYMGARLNEVCQLLVDDIIEVEGIQCIRINDDEATRQRLKNDASKRIVPIHSKLIALGFLDYVNARKKRGDQKLFPSLDNGRAKHNKYLGNWWGRYLDVVGVVGIGLDSHSFRHTAILAFKVAEVPETHAAAICGHEHGERDENGDKKKDSTYSMYGGQIPPEKLVKYVELLDWNINHSAFNGRLDASRPGARKKNSGGSR